MTAGFLLDEASGRPLHEQLYDAVRGAIVDGRLARGERLLSARALAHQLNLARNTVASAFQRLVAEGYLRTRHGAGTFVVDELPDDLLAAPAPAAQPRADVASASGGGLSRRGAAIQVAPRAYPTIKGGSAFRLGMPALDAFPSDRWGQLLARRWQRSSAALLRDTDLRGYAPLRAAIADYLGTARGVRCDADHIVIVAGAQQAFSLIAQTVLDPGDEAWVEDPGYPPARSAIVAAAGVPCPIPVDGEGIDVAEGGRRAPRARLAIVTPSNQFPLVVAMSDARRRALLSWAKSARAWVIEDDYDGEFRYVGRRLAALQGLDREAPVVYVGTFSKVMSPALRLGYVVVPDVLLDAVLASKAVACCYTPLLEQAVLSDFVCGGHFLRHVRRMRVLYDERREALVRLVRQEIGERGSLRPVEAGMHAVLDLPPSCDAVALSRRALAAGVSVRPLSFFHAEGAGSSALLLGFAAVRPEEQQGALKALAASFA